MTFVVMQFLTDGNKAQTVIAQFMVKPQRGLVPRHYIKSDRGIIRLLLNNFLCQVDRLGCHSPIAEIRINVDILNPCDSGTTVTNVQKTNYNIIKINQKKIMVFLKPIAERLICVSH